MARQTKRPECPNRAWGRPWHFRNISILGFLYLSLGQRSGQKEHFQMDSQKPKKKKKKKKKMHSPYSRREISSENHRIYSNKIIGCMSGIFHLLSRNHSRRLIPSASKKGGIETPQKGAKPDLAEARTGRSEILRRSPMLGSEIRRSGQAALVARLMGLENPLSESPSPVNAASPETTEEKRRRLIGALERCDEDLRALKRIIDAVRAAEMLRLSGGIGDSSMKEMKCFSPVSVLDDFSSPPNFRALENGREAENKAHSWAGVISSPLHRRMAIEGIPRLSSDSSSPAANFFPGGLRRRRYWGRSHALVDSVEEVGESAVRWESRETVMVGLELADDVAADLIVELATELMIDSDLRPDKTGRSCKRKLLFYI